MLLLLSCPLTSSLPQLTRILRGKRWASKTRLEGKRAFPQKQYERKESPPGEEESGPYLHGVSCPPTFSALNPVFGSNQHHLALQGEIPLENFSALKMRSVRKGSKEKYHSLHTHILWNPCDYSLFLLIFHSCFFTQHLLLLSLLIKKAILLRLAFKPTAAKWNFALFANFEAAVSDGNHVSTFLSSSKDHCNFSCYLLNRFLKEVLH